MAPTKPKGKQPSTSKKASFLNAVASAPKTHAKVSKAPSKSRSKPLSLENWTPESRRVKPVREGVLLPRDLAKLPPKAPSADMISGEDIPLPDGLEDEDQMYLDMDAESRRLALETDRIMTETNQGVLYGSFAEASSPAAKRDGSERKGSEDKSSDTTDPYEDGITGQELVGEPWKESLREVGLASARKHVSTDGKEEFVEKFWMNDIGQIVPIDIEDPESPTACNSIAKAKLKSKGVADPNGRFVGRHVVNWHRPRMIEKLLLCTQYECHRAGIAIPWDKIIHRLNPGSSGPTVTQMLNKMRDVLIREGHFIPPAMGKRGHRSDPMVRGYIRDESVVDEERAARFLYWTEPHDHRTESLCNSASRRSSDINSNSPTTMQSDSPTPIKAKTNRSRGRVETFKKSSPRVKREPTDDSDGDFNPKVGASRASRSSINRSSANAVRSDIPITYGLQGTRPKLIVRLGIAVEVPSGPGGQVRLAPKNKSELPRRLYSRGPLRRVIPATDEMQKDEDDDRKYNNPLLSDDYGPYEGLSSPTLEQPSPNSLTWFDPRVNAGGPIQLPQFQQPISKYGGCNGSTTALQSPSMYAGNTFDPASFGNTTSGLTSQSNFSSNAVSQNHSGFANVLSPIENSFGGNFGFAPHNGTAYGNDLFAISAKAGEYGDQSHEMLDKIMEDSSPFYGSVGMSSAGLIQGQTSSPSELGLVDDYFLQQNSYLDADGAEDSLNEGPFHFNEN